MPAHAIHNVLPDRFICKLDCDQDDYYNRRKDKNEPDTGKESNVLPNIREKIYRYVRKG